MPRVNACMRCTRTPLDGAPAVPSWHVPRPGAWPRAARARPLPRLPPRPPHPSPPSPLHPQVLQAEVRQGWRRSHEMTQPGRDLVLEAPLGRGGFGRVFRARWHTTPAAAKVLPPAADERRALQGAVEAAVLSMVHHPNIVQLYACLTDMVAVAPADTADASAGAAADASGDTSGAPAPAPGVRYRRLRPEEDERDDIESCSILVLEVRPRIPQRARAACLPREAWPAPVPPPARQPPPSPRAAPSPLPPSLPPPHRSTATWAACAVRSRRARSTARCQAGRWAPTCCPWRRCCWTWPTRWRTCTPSGWCTATSRWGRWRVARCRGGRVGWGGAVAPAVPQLRGGTALAVPREAAGDDCGERSGQAAMARGIQRLCCARLFPGLRAGAIL